MFPVNDKIKLMIDKIDESKDVDELILNITQTLDEMFNEAKRIGKEEGKREGKLETAENLLRLGIAVDIIQKATGLSKEDIEELKKKR